MGSAITILVLLAIAFILGYLLRSLFWGKSCGKIWGLMIPVLIVWTLFSAYWYVCHIKNQCGFKETVQISQPQMAEPVIKKVAEPIAVFPSWPLYFNWGSATPQLSDHFDSFKQKIINDVPDGDNLQITGYFAAAEINNTDFSDLGLARAYNIRELLADSLSDKRLERARMELTSEEFSHPDWKSEKPFDLVRFTNLKVNKNVEAVKDDNRLEYQQTFYFGSDSAKSDSQAELTAAMVEQINSGQQHVEVIGHADNVGNQEHNLKLALLRADAVKVLLVDLGVDAKLISVSSKGEGQPAVSNTTSAGRGQNRRAEVYIK